jgi:predicted nuclease with TOPRIM domain
MMDYYNATKLIDLENENTKLRAENAELKGRISDFEDDFRRVVNEDCAPDEKHCSCVPHLRRENAELKAELEQARKCLRCEREGDVADCIVSTDGTCARARLEGGE